MCFKDEVSPYSEKIFDQFRNNLITAIVPTIWPYEIAKETNLTIYDAAYLELAVRFTIPIASLDQELVKAARKVGVELYRAN